MDKVKARWQQHYDDYCFNELGGREPSGRERSDAEQYADDMMEEPEEDEHPIAGVCSFSKHEL